MKRNLLNFWPILFIFVLWFIFSSPYFLKGLVPFPSSYLVSNFGPWNEYVNFTGFVKNTATPDVITQIFPWKKIAVDIWRSGVVPLWNPYGFSGTPLLANYQSAVLSPLNILFFFLPFIDAWSLLILLQPLLAGFFMYIFVRSLKLSKVAALISSVAFMFCGFMTSWMVYGTLDYAVLFLPLALYSLEKLYEKNQWYYSALLGASVPLSFLSGHFQMSIYFLIFLFSYTTFKGFITRDLKSFVLSLVSVTLGLSIAAPQLLPSIELYLNSVRSELFMKTEVIPWAYIPTLVAPDIFGNPVTRNAWFGHYAEWNGYIGLVPLLLGFYSIRKMNNCVKFFLAWAGIAILLAFQSPLLDLLILAKVPVLSTSAASRIIVLFSFSFAVLSAFGFENLASDIKSKKYNYVIIWIISVFAAFVIIWGLVLFKLFIPEVQIPVAVSNLKLPTIFLGIFIMSVAASFIVKNKKALIAFSLIALLVSAFDLYRFSSKWQPFDPRNLVYPEVPIQNVLSSSKSYDRAFGSFGQELTLSFKLGGVEGYDPLYISRFGEFMGAAPDSEYHSASRSVVTFSKNGEYTGKILNFLGVKYIIHKIADGRAVWAFPFWEYPVDEFRQIFKDDKYEILVNDKAYPRAFMVSGYQVIQDKRKILQTMFALDLDLRNNAVIEENPNIKMNQSASGSANIKRYGSNEVVIETNSSGPGLLVLTDPYYPGWTAYVDGSKTKIFRTDYTFRGVFVPAGRHSVTFTYFPDSFKIGVIIAFVGLLGLAGVSIYQWKTKSLS